jgi:excisionase family DNA binding protein
MSEKLPIGQVLASVIEALEDRPPRVLDPKWDGRSTFDIGETAEILGISRWSAYRGAKTGEIPTTRIGKRYVVPRYALEKKLGA